MTLQRLALCLVLTAALGSACQLRRPDVLPARMIEPQLPESAAQDQVAADATPIRLLETQARGHIGRGLLHEGPGGELMEDPVWRWSSPPDRYLDSALRRTLASSADLHPVDAANVPTMAVTLTSWNLESGDGGRLVGAVELTVTTADRSVVTEVIRASEPVSADRPGNLAAAAGRLLTTLATDCLTRTSRVVHQP